MASKAKKPGEGVDTSRGSDLRDDRQGAFDPVGNQKKTDASEPTDREREQPGGSIQGEPIPTKSFNLPEGLKRQPMGPYSRDNGRSKEIPEHIPRNRPKS